VSPDESDAKKAAIVKSLRNGCTRTASAGAAGIARSTFYEWLEADADFKAACENAELAAVHEIESVLHGKAKDGNMQAIKFELVNASRRGKGDWEDEHTQRVKHDGPQRVIISEEGIAVEGQGDEAAPPQ
jgi:hypothetical protein